MQEEGPGQRHANTWTEFAFPAGLAEVNEYLGRAVFGAPDGGRNRVILKALGCWG